MDIHEYRWISRNLYRRGDCYYRLFAMGVTPNGCWLYGAEMRELKDINIATGKDVCGNGIESFDIGVIQASTACIWYTK